MRESTTANNATARVWPMAKWELLRIWHLEAMESVIASPTLATFTRTSYASVPAHWRDAPARHIAPRVAQLLHAHYRIRAATLRTADCDERMVPFAFEFEWVTRGDVAGAPDARSDPWMLPCANHNHRLSEIAWHELDGRLRAARAGLDSQCYGDAFEVFQIDQDDTWHIIDWKDRAAMFAARHGGR